MQGDHMRLNDQLTSILPQSDSLPKRGLCVVACNANGVAINLRLLGEKAPLQPQEEKLKYFANGWQTRLGAKAYFFEEGKAARFSKAQYGGLQVDADGNSVLTGLYNSARHLMIP